MELKRLEAKEKLEFKTLEAAKKRASREEEHCFRRELMLDKFNRRNNKGPEKKESESKGLEEAIMARVQEQRFDKMEQILEKIAEKWTTTLVKS